MLCLDPMQRNGVQGIPKYIDTVKQAMSYKDAMSQPNAPEWVEEHQNEYLGFKDRNAFGTVLLPKGAMAL